jgi:hypothetical protein
MNFQREREEEEEKRGRREERGQGSDRDSQREKWRDRQTETKTERGKARDITGMEISLEGLPFAEERQSLFFVSCHGKMGYTSPTQAASGDGRRGK